MHVGIRTDWMLKAPVSMRAEHDLIERVVSWFVNAGWRVIPGKSLEHSLRAHSDAVLETAYGKILINAKRRGKDEAGRVEIETYPDGNRIYLVEQADSSWKVRTESNTYDPRKVDEKTLPAILDEMLGRA